jgi:ligand-binding sensor domain-containing protein
MKRAAFVVAAVALLYATPLRARTPEIVNDPRDGVWIAQDDKFIFNTLDRWSVFSAGATVNKMVIDQTILWLATDDGVIRFDIGSQKSTKLTMDDGLPSQRISTVAFDDQYVWFGTNKGLVRYRKTDRALKVYDEGNGLPSKAVTYSVTIGRQVWFGTRAGIAVYNPDVDGFRAFGEADGMASGDVAEVFQFGADIWCRTDVGLSRFRIQQRVFNNFPMSLMGAQQIRVMTVEGENLWLGTDNGLWLFESASDAIRIFPDKEILQYNKLTKGIRRFTEAEQLRRQEGSTGSLSTAKFVTVLFPDMAEIYSPAVDQWMDRPIALTAAIERKTNARIFGALELEQPFTDGKRDAQSAYATAVGGVGFGRQL